MSTALYRRYRPETFADVIGQEHVTDPLRAALRGDRITHAYLFSGPRGCGKTTSARIFARCLNCAEGPTDTPCGTCPSCVELARDGAGSLDVVEMDAASHGGVDDARELRERAAFAPARDRYKIFIIDEAHMVTSQGFNALLKLVEEPPAHVKFVFATTEPEKVIGTIRSRTHHYPFRLVPPERLQGYLEELCTAEGVRVASGVLPLVVRAGGGSVRDSLSVLDQLIAGAEDGEVNYERAVSLLGYTHATLLDDVVDALAARDGGSLFRVVDRVIDSGHDPRRFAEDLLERLRDLVVIAVSGDQASAVLRSLSADQFERMRVQSRQLGPAELSRAGDLVNDALTEMSGATSPRLQLELMCARLLLPGADDASRGHAARLDRIERHLSAGTPVPAAPASTPAAASSPSRETAPAALAPAGFSEEEPVTVQGRAAEETRTAAASGSTPGDRPAPTPQPAQPPAATPQPTEAPAPAPAQQPTEAPAPPPTEPVATPVSQPAQPPAPASGDAELIRRRWSEVLATLARFKRSTWALVSQNAQVGDVSGGVLHLAFATSGLAHTFRTGAHDEPLQRALVETLGVRVRIEPVLSQGAESGAPAPTSGEPAAAAGWGDPRPAAPPADAGGYEPPRDSGLGGASPTTGGATAVAGAAASPADAPGSWSAQSPGEPSARPQDASSPPESSQRPRPGTPNPERGRPPASSPASAPTPPVAAAPAQPVAVVPLAEDTPSMDDPDAENSGLVGAPLIEQMLGGTIISEEERS